MHVDVTISMCWFIDDGLSLNSFGGFCANFVDLVQGQMTKKYKCLFGRF